MYFKREHGPRIEYCRRFTIRLGIDRTCGDSGGVPLLIDLEDDTPNYRRETFASRLCRSLHYIARGAAEPLSRRAAYSASIGLI